MAEDWLKDINSVKARAALFADVIHVEVTHEIRFNVNAK